MELSICKSNGKDKKADFISCPILDYKVIANQTSLLLVQQGKMTIESEGKSIEKDFLEIHKVQFVANCKTELFENLLVAFYLGEGNELYPYILSGLTSFYHQPGDEFMLIDYKSYLEICNYTGESPMSLGDFIKHKKACYIGINTLLLHQEQYLNFTNQEKLSNNQLVIDKSGIN